MIASSSTPGRRRPSSHNHGITVWLEGCEQGGPGGTHEPVQQFRIGGWPARQNTGDTSRTSANHRFKMRCLPAYTRIDVLRLPEGGSDRRPILCRRAVGYDVERRMPTNDSWSTEKGAARDRGWSVKSAAPIAVNQTRGA